MTIKKALACVIIRNDEIGCFTRGNRTYRSGELDTFMGGEINARETPYNALIREMKEKVYIKNNKVKCLGNITVLHGILIRTVFYITVNSDVEPVFFEPLPNKKYIKFEWIEVTTIKEMSSKGSLSSESLYILKKANIVT